MRLSKKVVVLAGLLSVLFGLAGCSVLGDDRNASDVQYGSLVIGSTESRCIDVSQITKARVKVYSSDFSAIEKDVEITDGSGKVSAFIDNIPVGKNRIVKVQAYNSASELDGVTLAAITEIKPQENSVAVNWNSSCTGYVYDELCTAGVKIAALSSDDISRISAAIPDVHACLVNAKQIALDYKAGSLGAAETYKNSAGTVKVTGSSLKKSYTVCVDDIASKKAGVSGSSGAVIDGVLPGNWTFTLYEGTSVVKTVKVPVKAGKETFVNITEASETDTSRITVHVPVKNSQKYIYAWTETGASVTEFAGKWPGTEMPDSDGDGYYDYSFDASISSCSIIFNDGNSDQTEDLCSPAKGEWKYTGGKTGTGTNSDWEAWITIPSETTLTVTAPAGAKVSLPDSCSFTTDSKTITVTATACTTAKYTVDGTDPKNSAAAVSFTDSVDVTIGEDSAIGDKITVKVWGTDGSDESAAESTFEKAKKSDKPETPARLGAYYRETDTQFTIWSPDSSNVKVCVKKRGESTFTDYTCTKNYNVNGDYPDSGNIYGVKVEGDCKLAEYQFYINGKAVRDPYGMMVKYEDADAKTNVIKENYEENNCSVTSYAGSSVNIVMDMDSIEPTGGWAARPALAKRTDSIVYEVHVGDFTSSSTWGGTAANAGKFPGMVEAGTKYQTVKTGLDHLKELGVTHVQLMPVYDMATKVNNTINEFYNWGYDPVNYNVPEDRYSTCPSDYEARVREFKDMINEFHKNGIRVVMDVVYNHTFDGEMFNKISSKYYTSSDLSGCGNSINDGVPMVSRMIRDSLEYWATQYGIDGFRFDLIGIFRYAQANAWGKYLNSTYPDRTFIIYGEPWNGYAEDSAEGEKVRMNKVPQMAEGHVGVFNGKFRETVKGQSDKAGGGFMFNKNFDGESTWGNVCIGLKGSGTGMGSLSDLWTRTFTSSPEQTINYITAHDNLCLADRIDTEGVKDAAYKAAIVKFGHGIMLVSQGIPFIHCGDEFLRTKKVGPQASNAHNSYMFGTRMNQIDWALKAANIGMFNYHKDLIAFRKANDCFRSNSSSNVGSTSIQDGMILYKVGSYTVALNPGADSAQTYGTEVLNCKGLTTSGGGTQSALGKCQGTTITIFKN